MSEEFDNFVKGLWESGACEPRYAPDGTWLFDANDILRHKVLHMICLKVMWPIAQRELLDYWKKHHDA